MKPSLFRIVAAVIIVASFVYLAPAGAAGEPYEIGVIASLTGSASFQGIGEMKTLRAFEQQLNRSGGLRGRPIRFVFKDDASSAANSVQLLNALIASKAPVVLGSSLVSECNAMAPLLKDGPLLYCFSPGFHPDSGTFGYSSGASTKDLIKVAIRYLRERGWKRMALITSVDATGQDADRSLDEAFKLSENHDITVVAREHFAITDLSVTAQITRIKGTNAQVIITWATGTPEATILRGINDAGLEIPVLANVANASSTQMQQYAAILPKELYCSGVPVLAPETVSDKATQLQLKTFFTALRATGIDRADYVYNLAWDSALLVVAGLQKYGLNATPAQLRDFLSSNTSVVGVNGHYDFKTTPQRGLGQNAVFMIRWNADKNAWIGVSKLGGLPLRSK